MACFSEDCHWVKRHGDCFYDGVPPSNSPSDCKKCQFSKAPTNADRIRAMSDEELAGWIKRLIIDSSLGRCDTRGVWTKAEIAGGEIVPWLDWLRQEVTDG